MASQVTLESNAPSQQNAAPSSHPPQHARRGFNKRGRGGHAGGHAVRGEKANVNPAVAESDESRELKTKYRSQLNTLRELFSDWTDEDLVFALQEASGDLDVTIARISEGLSNQWGEVKTKKEKKTEPKAQVPTTTAPAPASDKRASRGTFERGRGRGESTRARGERGRGAGRGASQSTSRPPRQNGTPVNGASTAPAAAAAAPDIAWGAHDDWSNTKTSSWADAVTDGAAEKAAVVSKPAAAPVPAESKPAQVAPAAPAAATAPSAPASIPPAPSTSKTIPAKPKASWAQIVKPEPKPEPKPAPKPAAASAAPAPTRNPQDIKPSAKPAQAAEPSDGPDAKVQVSELETQSIPVADITNEPSQNVQTVAPLASQAPAPVGPPGFNKPQTNSGSYSRRLKQDAAVVMPGQANNLGSVGVQFGSLSLSSAHDEALVDEKKAATNVAPEAPVQQPSQQPNEPAQALSHPQQYPSQVGYPSQQAYRQQQGFDGSAQLQSQSSYLPQPSSTTAESTQFNSAQSPYAAFPGQPAGFGLGQSQDYAALYGSSDAQRAAMGYYDPATYGQPGYGQQQQGRTADSKFGQQGQDALGSSASSTTPGSAPSTTPQQQQQQQQQAYPGMGMPYYPYYYMPNQFPGAYQQSGYGQSGYGQPFVNQSRYPPYNQQGQGQGQGQGHQGRHQNNKGGAGAAAGGYQQQYSQQQSYDTDASASAGSFGQYDRYAAGGNDQFNSFLGGQQGKQSYDKQQSSTPTAESAQYSQAQYGSYQQQAQQQSQPQAGAQSQPQSAGFGSNSGYGQYLGGYPQGQGQQRSQQYWSQ